MITMRTISEVKTCCKTGSFFLHTLFGIDHAIQLFIENDLVIASWFIPQNWVFNKNQWYYY